MGSKKTRRRAQARRRQGVRKGIPLGLDDAPTYVEIEMLIKCRKCGAELEAEKYFTRRTDTKRGYQYECRTCRAALQRKRRVKHERKEAAKPREPPLKVRRDQKTPHRKKVLQKAGEKIAAGAVVAESARGMTFALSLIIEQQLRLFYSKQINSPAASLKLARILEDALFEIKQAFSRAGIRMRPICAIGELTVDLEGSMKSLQAKAAARTLLGVQECATKEEIKKAYLAKARVAHPDHKGRTEEMQKINEALTLLVEGTNGQ